jgi:hypothetical protein
VRVNSISPRVAELVLFTTKRYKLKIVQVYAPTTSYSDEDINNFHNDVDENLGKPNHYTVVMGDFNANSNRQNTKPCGNGNGHIWAWIEKRKRRHLGRMATSRKYKIMNTMFQKKAEGDGRRKTQTV